MSVIILGGNECMERQYKDLCKEYKCRAKVFIKPSGSLRNKLGNPDLMIILSGGHFKPGLKQSFLSMFSLLEFNVILKFVGYSLQKRVAIFIQGDEKFFGC